MKFSILLPTRNRLDLLKFAVQSVLDQDHQNWEIVIADNASEDDVAGFARDLNDDRIRYQRSDRLLPVTDNWNRALEGSKGDYVIMLGDDDCLLSGCLTVAATLIKEYAEPDLIYTEALQFAYPNVIPGFPKGFVQYGHCEFLSGETDPFVIKKSRARACVQKALSFQIAYSYNMQHSIMNRKMVTRLEAKGPFFQSPYPDYYATNALFLSAERILICPWPLVGIGISPKSFGFYYFNNRESQGTEFLQNIADPDVLNRIKDKVVPGSNMNTSWLLSMETLEKNFPENGLGKIEYKNYRFMQFQELWRAKKSSSEFLQALRSYASFGERVFWYGFLGVDAVTSTMLSKDFVHRILRRLLATIHESHPRFDARMRTVEYENILELSRREGGIREVPDRWRDHLGIEARQ